jgi:hypothetical protein
MERQRRSVNFSYPICVSQFLFWASLIASSTMFLVPLYQHEATVCGHCALYTTGTWNETNGKLMVKWSEGGYCDFAIAVAIINNLVAIVQGSRN